MQDRAALDPAAPDRRALDRAWCWPAASAAGPRRRQISGALIAPGQIVVESNVKKVQHPTGGVVGEVRAHDGDVVKAGDIVVRLDDTVTKANLAIVTKNLDAALARAARLEAEQRGLDKIEFPPAAARPRQRSRRRRC